MQYTIRVIEKRDNEIVEKIIRSCLVEFGADHEGTAWTDQDLCRFSEIYNTDGCRYWVAEDENGKIVGGTGIGPLDTSSGICELQKMYCIPEARGTGAAEALLKTAIIYAQNYYSSCYLETLENMTAAQRFYEKHGFVRTYDVVTQTGHFACDVHYIRTL